MRPRAPAHLGSERGGRAPRREESGRRPTSGAGGWEEPRRPLRDQQGEGVGTRLGEEDSVALSFGENGVKELGSCG